MKVNLLEKATGLFVALSITAVIFVTPVMSQEEDEDAAELGKIQVTGSRLKQTDIQTAQPVTVITREEIELSGFATVAEVLQSTPYNSFGSFKETSGYANGQAVVNEISLRGLGSARTLLLLDGRRVSNTGGSGGAAANLNQIPTSIIERVDILRDGASAIYGSDAIAGVINIITRKDYDGMDFSMSKGSPDTAGAEYTTASITGGTSNAKGNVFYTIQHYSRDPQFYRDVPYAAYAHNNDYYSNFGFPATFYSPYFGYVADERCPGSLDNPGAPVGSAADDGTNSDPNYPNAYTWDYYGYAFCGYDFAQDIMSIPKAERNSMLLKSSMDISPDVTMNTVLMISQNEGMSRFAATPVTSPYPTMKADNPNHPLIGMGYDCSVMDCLGATIFMRTVPNGTRDNHVTENIQDIRIGFEGIFDILGGMNWEVNGQIMNNRTDNQTKNLVNKSLLQAGIDAGQVDLFGVHGTSYEALSAVLQGYNHTKLYSAELKAQTLDFLMSFDIGELAGGPIGIAFGAEHNQLYFAQENDPASNSLIIAGTAGGDNVTADRSRKSAFFEIGLPFTEKLDVNLAGRNDSYSAKGTGSNFSPQITFAYRPIDWMLLRGTYGEGFRAAAMTQLYGNRSESFPSGIDLVGCANGVEICTPKQFRTLYGGNPDLKPELSTSYTFGVVLAPLPELTIQLGFWHTDFTNLITTSSVSREFAAEAAGETNYVYRTAQGTVDYISLQMNNYEGVEAEGIDFDVSYIIQTENMGRFDIGLNAAKYTKYISQAYESSPKIEYQGDIGLPDLRMNQHIYWGKGDWSAALTGYYTSAMEEEYGDTTYSLGSHFEIGIQMSYQLPWNASITVGANNLTNEEPEQNQDWYGWEPFDFSLYDTRGRLVYFRYSQSL